MAAHLHTRLPMTSSRWDCCRQICTAARACATTCAGGRAEAPRPRLDARASSTRLCAAMAPASPSSGLAALRLSRTDERVVSPPAQVPRQTVDLPGVIKAFRRTRREVTRRFRRTTVFHSRRFRIKRRRFWVSVDWLPNSPPPDVADHPAHAAHRARCRRARPPEGPWCARCRARRCFFLEGLLRTVQERGVAR